MLRSMKNYIGRYLELVDFSGAFAASGAWEHENILLCLEKNLSQNLNNIFKGIEIEIREDFLYLFRFI